jgi:hypothetical protein
MQINTNGFDLSVSSLAAEESFPTHSVLLHQPMPGKVTRLFAFLNEPYQTAAGTVFILEDGKPPRKDHDESLVAR